MPDLVDRKRPTTAKKTHAHIIHRKKSPEVMKSTITILGTKFIAQHVFSSGHTAPIYEINDVYALNQIIGYVKFINREYGTVLYRGQCRLYPSLSPSLFRECMLQGSRDTCITSIKQLIRETKENEKINRIISTIKDDDDAIESMLQHYGIKTRWLDVVDNHWIALWFGLYRTKEMKQAVSYRHFQIRTIDYVDPKRYEDSSAELYQYILLIAVDAREEIPGSHVLKGEHISTVDLRRALPSTFVRPHAQHGYTIKKTKLVPGDDMDIANNVVAILKVRIDNASIWLGNGTLTSPQNIFPPPSYDHGYDHLLQGMSISTKLSKKVGDITRFSY